MYIRFVGRVDDRVDVPSDSFGSCLDFPDRMVASAAEYFSDGFGCAVVHHSSRIVCDGVVKAIQVLVDQVPRIDGGRVLPDAGRS